MIYLTSDLHFNHEKEFIWKARGFSSVEEMNKEIIKRWNNVVNPEDEVYIAGDLMLGDTDKGIALVNKLNGFKRIIIGNHDTDNRIEAYKIGIKNLLSIEHATRFRYGKNVFWVSHYAADTSNYDDQKTWVKNLINLYGHTHQTHTFYADNPYKYNVGVDAHNCTPVSIEQIIEEIRQKKIELDHSIGGQP